MTTIPANPKVEAIRELVRNSDATLHQLIDGPLARLDASKLYQSPTENEWTIMQNLSHIVEFMLYWAGEIEKLIAEPDCEFGRMPDDVERLHGVSEHETNSLKEIKATLPGSYARLDEVLGRLKDSDLELTGKHVRYGDKPLDWLIEEFVTNHLSGHVEQIERCIELVR
jgi:DinB superfamily